MIRFYCAVRNLIRTCDDGYYHANHENLGCKGYNYMLDGSAEKWLLKLGRKIFIVKPFVESRVLNAINRSLN